MGEQTTTGDIEGEVISTRSTADVTASRVQQAMKKFIGTIDQVPPMFSAIKFQGKPLYELARRGIEVERKSRTVTIFSLTLHEFSPEHVSFHIHCSKGTYIRTLIEDIGNELGCGAHVVELRRTQVTPYSDALMYTLPELESIAEKSGFTGLSATLLPVETSVQIFPAVKLSTSAAFYLRMGQSIRATLPINSTLVRLMSEDARFLGMGEVLPDGRVKPHRMLGNAVNIICSPGGAQRNPGTLLFVLPDV